MAFPEGAIGAGIVGPAPVREPGRLARVAVETLRKVPQILSRRAAEVTLRATAVVVFAAAGGGALAGCDDPFATQGGKTPTSDGGAPVAPPTQSEGGSFEDYYRYCKDVAYQGYNEAVAADKAAGIPVTPQTEANFYGPEADCQAEFYDGAPDPSVNPAP